MLAGLHRLCKGNVVTALASCYLQTVASPLLSQSLEILFRFMLSY